MTAALFSPIEKRTVAERIAKALRDGFGDSKSAAKQIGRITWSNDRTAENWLGARCAPNAADLIELMRESDEVLNEVLRLADRADLMECQRIRNAVDQLSRALEPVRGP